MAAAHNVCNPVLLARRVMNDSAHVMLMGEGAEAFAPESGLAEAAGDPPTPVG